jgi:hypothetical protein
MFSATRLVKGALELIVGTGFAGLGPSTVQFIAGVTDSPPFNSALTASSGSGERAACPKGQAKEPAAIEFVEAAVALQERIS